MGSETTAPDAITSITVSVEDVVSAHEFNRQGVDRAVLRVTPPFHGRMRARLHVERDADTPTDPPPVVIAPERLIDVDWAPEYPRADATEDELRADQGAEYSIEAHYERHVRALERWRAGVRTAIVDAIELETARGTHRVAVKTLDGGRGD